MSDLRRQDTVLNSFMHIFRAFALEIATFLSIWTDTRKRDKNKATVRIPARKDK